MTTLLITKRIRKEDIIHVNEDDTNDDDANNGAGGKS